MTVEYLMDRELEAVLGLLMPSNRLVCQLSLRTGLRVGDILALKTEQLKPNFWVTEQKTGKRRQVGIPGPLLAEIRAQAGDPYAFPSRDGKGHRSRQAVWADVKRAQAAMRLTQNIGPHSMRKVYAVDVLRRYGDVSEVQKRLNHSSQTVTMLYALAAARLESRHFQHATRYGKRL